MYVKYCVETFDVTSTQVQTCERLNVRRGDSTWDWTAEMEPQELRADQIHYKVSLIEGSVPKTPRWLPWLVDKYGILVPPPLTVADVASGN